MKDLIMHADGNIVPIALPADFDSFVASSVRAADLAVEQAGGQPSVTVYATGTTRRVEITPQSVTVDDATFGILI